MVVSLDDYQPRERFDGNAWTTANLEISADLETWTINESVTFDDPDEDPAVPKDRRFTTVITDSEARYIRVVFVDDYDNEDITEPVALAPTPQLATVTDVRNRLARPLTEPEETQVGSLITAATVNILNAVDKDADWTIPPEIKPLLAMLCVEVVSRAMSNPQAIGQESETLGAYSHTTTYAREIPGSGLLLTNVEELLIRRAVWGTNAGTARGYQRDLYLYGQESAVLEPVRIIE